MKKQSVGFYATILVLLLTVVSFVLYNQNAANAYYNDSNTIVVYVSIAAIALAVVTLILGQFSESNLSVGKIVAVLRVALPALIMLAGLLFVGDRVYSYAIIFGSDLESGNVLAQEAATQSVIAVVCYVVTALIATVSAFFAMKKEK